MAKPKIKAVFMDRDGTVIFERPGHYLSKPGEVKLYKSTLPALKIMADLGYKLFIVSNQSGIGRGYFTAAEVDAVHKHLLKMLRPFKVEEIIYCPHAPSDPCNCRKPAPQMGQILIKKHNIDTAASFMIGDKRSDVDFGLNLGLRPVLVRTANGAKQAKKYKAELKSAKITNNLLTAANYIKSLT